MGDAMIGAIGMLAGLGLYLAALLAAIRFLLQAAHVDAYNPVTQYVIRVTNPVLSPMRALLPSGDRVDMASLVAVWLLQIAQLALIREPAIGLLLFGGLVQAIDLFANLYFFALIIVVVMSFVAPATGHPAAVILRQLTEPLLAPVRRVVPPVGGLDFSVLVVLFVLMFVRGGLLPWLGAFVGL